MTLARLRTGRRSQVDDVIVESAAHPSDGPASVSESARARALSFSLLLSPSLSNSPHFPRQVWIDAGQLRHRSVPLEEDDEFLRVANPPSPIIPHTLLPTV